VDIGPHRFWYKFNVLWPKGVVANALTAEFEVVPSNPHSAKGARWWFLIAVIMV
jgi:hypothetical protein